MASSVRIGSPGNGSRARSTISGAMRRMCQCEAAAARYARRSAASTSVSSPRVTARMSTRSHSIRVRSEATMNSAAANDLRTSCAELSSKSQARMALDSAYRFTWNRALHPAAARHCVCQDACAAMPCTGQRHQVNPAWRDRASPRHAALPEQTHRLAHVRAVRTPPRPRPGPSPAHSRLRVQRGDTRSGGS